MVVVVPRGKGTDVMFTCACPHPFPWNVVLPPSPRIGTPAEMMLALINYTLAVSNSDIRACDDDSNGINSENNDGALVSGTSRTVMAVPLGRTELLSLRRILLESLDIYSPINVEIQLQAAQDPVCVWVGGRGWGY